MARTLQIFLFVIYFKLTFVPDTNIFVNNSVKEYLFLLISEGNLMYLTAQYVLNIEMVFYQEHKTNVLFFQFYDSIKINQSDCRPFFFPINH